ncbi:MAG: hypothetical protein WC748_04265 [Legionellales bacterium]
MPKLTPNQRQIIEDFIASEDAVNAAKLRIEAVENNPERKKLVEAKVTNEKDINSVNEKWKSNGLTFPDADSKARLEALSLTEKVILSNISIFDAQITKENSTIKEEEGFQRTYLVALKPLTLQEIAQAKSEVRNELKKLEEGSRSPVASPSSFIKSLLTKKGSNSNMTQNNTDNSSKKRLSV